MLVLGIDTSCDDTSAALLSFDNGSKPSIRSNVVSSQEEIHVKYGGIVPELASRKHMEMIWPVVEEALAGTSPKDLDLIAVCHGPGLIGSLLVGTSFTKSLSLTSRIPFIGVNHLEGHLLSAFLTEPAPDFPLLSLVVSGGHTSLYMVEGFGIYTELGRTRDDAAGEAYDKISKLLGLGYPGGPAIDRLAAERDENAVSFPRLMLKDNLDFSFSGLKTSVRLKLEKDPDLRKEHIASAFQNAVVEVLVRKTRMAMDRTGIKMVTLSGGVAANSALREHMAIMCRERGARFFPPPISLCTDNGAMIALAGFHRFKAGETSELGLNPRAHLPIGL